MWEIDVVEKSTYFSFKYQIELFMKQLVHSKIAIWGASVRGIIAGIILEDFGIKEFIFYDNDVDKQGKNLSGHLITSFHPKDKSETILLSMENQKSVKQQLEECGWQENQNFFCLLSSDIENLMEEITSLKNCKYLLFGASCLHAVPIMEREEDDLAEMIKKQCANPIKVLGLSCISMKIFYYLFMLEIKLNKKLSNMVLLINWDIITSFHHLLPRTQKPFLIKRLAEYAEERKEIELSEKLYEEYRIAKERAEDYKFENQHAISLIKDKREVSELPEDYLSQNLMEPLDLTCEEIQYLIMILELAKDIDIDVTLIIEPLNEEMCKEIYGDAFDKLYQRKCELLKDLSAKYGIKCIDASSLLSSEMILSRYSANEAFFSTGRKKFAEYIIKNI